MMLTTFRPFHDDILQWADHRGEAVAIVSGDTEVTYRQLAHRVDAWFVWLVRNGIGNGSRVAVSLGNTSDHIALVLALSLRGAAHLSLNPAEGAAANQKLIDTCAIHYLITGFDLDLRRCMRVALPTMLDVGGNAGRRSRQGVRPETVWKMVLSSGSTGTPKLVMQTHAMERSYCLTYPSWDDGGDVRFLQTIALNFSLGLRLCLSVLMAGKTVVLTGDSLVAGTMVELLERKRITHLVTTPFHAISIARAVAEGHRKPGHLRNVLLGGSRVTEFIQRRIRQDLCENLYVGYGTNEVGYLAVATPTDLSAYPNTIGFPVPGIDISVVTENGREAEPGETGLLRARGPDYPISYFRNPVADALAFRDGWFYPGDVASKGPDGELYFKGRADDLINFNGIKIAPIDIEACLTSHPAVHEAVAFVLTHRVHHELPAVCVTLNQPVTDDELLEFAAKRMRMRSPKYVMVVDSIPVMGIGKPDRKAIHTEALRRLG